MKVAAKIGLITFTALVLQISLLSDLRPLSAEGDVMLLLGIAAGLAGGPDRGAIVGFVAGLSYDLLLHSPFGLSALVYCLTGYFVGSFQTTVLRSSAWIPVVCTAIASAVGVIMFAVIGEVIGQDSFVSSALLRIVLVVVLINAVLARPAVGAMRWAFSDGLPSRVATR